MITENFEDFAIELEKIGTKINDISYDIQSYVDEKKIKNIVNTLEKCKIELKSVINNMKVIQEELASH